MLLLESNFYGGRTQPTRPIETARRWAHSVPGAPKSRYTSSVETMVVCFSWATWEVLY